MHMEILKYIHKSIVFSSLKKKKRDQAKINKWIKRKEQKQ